MMTRDVVSCDVLFQEEECQENYVKKCFIEYAKTAQNVTVSVCRTPLVKDCSVEGEEVGEGGGDGGVGWGGEEVVVVERNGGVRDGENY